MEYFVTIILFISFLSYVSKNKLLLFGFFPVLLWFRVPINIPGFTVVYLYDILNLYIVINLFNYFLIQKKTFKLNLLDKVIVTFTSIFFLYYFIGMNDDTSRVFYEKIMVIFQYFFYITILKQNTDIYKALKYYLSSYIIIISIGVFAFLFPNSFSEGYIETIKYTYNYTALRFTLLQPASNVLLFVLFFWESKSRILFIPLLFFSIVLSGGRTEIIVFILFIFLYLIIGPKISLSSILFKGFALQRFFYVFATIVLIILLSNSISYVASNYGSLPNYLVRYYQLIVNPAVASGNRVEYIEYSQEKISKNLVLGNKIYSAKNLLSSGISVEETSALSGRSHNNFIAVTYAYGIIGLFIYLFIIVLYFRTTIKFSPESLFDSKIKYVLLFLLIGELIRSFSIGDYYNLFIYPPIASVISELKNISKR